MGLNIYVVALENDLYLQSLISKKKKLNQKFNEEYKSQKSHEDSIKFCVNMETISTLIILAVKKVT